MAKILVLTALFHWHTENTIASIYSIKKPSKRRSGAQCRFRAARFKKPNPQRLSVRQLISRLITYRIGHVKRQSYGVKVKRTQSHAGVKAARKGSAINSFCGWDGETLVLNILGTPGAKQDVIGKVKGNQLKVSVTATPVAGRATDHMVRFLAKEFGVSINDIEVVFGRFNVNKQLRIKSPGKLPSVIDKHLFTVAKSA